MSYSFNAKGATREECGAQVREKLDQVEIAQPVHTELHDVHQTAVQLLGLTRNLEAGEQYAASVSGSCWQVEGKDGFESVQANVQISIAKA